MTWPRGPSQGYQLAAWSTQTGYERVGPEAAMPFGATGSPEPPEAQFGRHVYGKSPAGQASHGQAPAHRKVAGRRARWKSCPKKAAHPADGVHPGILIQCTAKAGTTNKSKL